MHVEKLMELGTRLKERRRELGLEREEVAIKLKVSAKTLYALEEALVDSLPQPIFARGFTRSYAKALDMDQEALNPLIDEAFPSEVIDNINPELSSQAREQSITINQTSNSMVIMAAVAILVLVMGGAGWAVYYFFSDNIKEAVSRQAPAAQDTGNAGADTPPQVYAPAPGNSPADSESTAFEPALSYSAASGSSAQNQDPVSRPAAGAPPTNTLPAADATPPDGAPAGANTEPAVDSANYPPTLATQSNARADVPVRAGLQRVVLFAKYECWIGAEFDETGRRSFTLEPGQTFVLDFRQRLRLTLGNAGGIDMSYNGRPFSTGGRFQESRVLNFPPQS